MPTSHPCLRGVHANCQAADTCECRCHAISRGMKREQGQVDFAWEDPPAGSGKASPLLRKLEPLIVDLRKHPGKSARLLVYKSTHGASSAARRARKCFPDVAFTARTHTDGTSTLYGQFEEDV